MPKALNRVRSHCMHFDTRKTYKYFTTIWEAYLLLLRRKIVDDAQVPLVVLPLHICPNCFFVAGL
jgi:hypothetical protein